MLFTSFRTDRIGMQIYSILWTINYCEKNNHTYIHTPLEEKYEALFNLGLNYKKLNEIDSKAINKGPSNSLQEIIKNKSFPDFSSEFREKIIDKYNITNKLSSDIFIKSKGIKICIHCRRGDTTALSQNAHVIRYTPDSFLIKVFQKINEYFTRSSVSIHIYSDSIINMENIEAYNLNYNFNIYTHFEDNIITTFNDMISCDILFKYGVSAFSGICAIYNSNIVISDIDREYENLYKFNNIYHFDDCDNIF